jgi:hypothetical protein
MRAADPRCKVIGEAVRLLVGTRHDDHWPGCRNGGASCGEMGRPSDGGHAEHARIRQKGPEGVDERGYATITAA